MPRIEISTRITSAIPKKAIRVGIFLFLFISIQIIPRIPLRGEIWHQVYSSGNLRNAILKLYIFDAGQGLCLFARNSAGNSLLHDCGGSGSLNKTEILKKLKEMSGEERLDVLIISHNHGDHTNFPGESKRKKSNNDETSLLEDLLRHQNNPEHRNDENPATYIYVPFQWEELTNHMSDNSEIISDDQHMSDLPMSLSGPRIPIEDLSNYVRFFPIAPGENRSVKGMGDPDSCRILTGNNDPSTTTGESNDSSLVLHIQHGRINILLPGDGAKKPMTRFFELPLPICCAPPFIFWNTTAPTRRTPIVKRFLKVSLPLWSLQAPESTTAINTPIV